jgi:hypothetical protein
MANIVVRRGKLLAHQLFEAVFEEQGHRSVQMSSHTAQTMTFVRVDLLFEQGTLLGQCFRKHHALLIVDIVVGRAVYLWMEKMYGYSFE